MSPISSRKSVPRCACSNFPTCARGRSSKRSLLVPEQLRFHQLGGNRRAVQRNKRSGVPRAFFVERARDQFLARARFAANAHARLARRHLFDLRHHLAHRRAGPDDVVRPSRCFSSRFSSSSRFRRSGVLNGQQQLVGGDRLLEKIDGAEPRGAYRHLDGRLPGHHHDRRRDADRLQVFEQRDAVLARASPRRRESDRSARPLPVRARARHCRRRSPRGPPAGTRAKATRACSRRRR